MHNTLPVTLSNNLLTFRDTDKTFELQGDLLKMITSKNYNVDLGTSQERKMIIMYDFAKEMYFDERAPGNKSTRDRSLIRLLKSPGIIVSGSGVPSSHKKNLSEKQDFLSSNPNELCDRVKFLLQEKQAGNKSDIIDEKIIAIAHKLLEYKCVSTKQHKILLIK